MFWCSIFPLRHQNAYGHQGGVMLRGALTHKYAWHLNEVVLWDHVTICRRCMDTKLGKLLTSYKRLPNMTLWSRKLKRGHKTVWKIYISTFVRFTAHKLGRLLAFGKVFSMQTLKSPPSFALFLSYMLLMIF